MSGDSIGWGCAHVSKPNLGYGIIVGIDYGTKDSPPMVQVYWKASKLKVWHKKAMIAIMPNLEAMMDMVK